MYLHAARRAAQEDLQVGPAAAIATHLQKVVSQMSTNFRRTTDYDCCFGGLGA